MSQRSPNPPADGPIPADMTRFSSRRRGDGWDVQIARLAEKQNGLISLDQLRALGLAERTVHDRVAVGRLHQVHQGVYSVGHPLLTRDGRFMAAVLACGPGATLSHRSAAALWGIREDARASIDVIAPNRRGRNPPRIDAHRDGSLAPDDRTALRNIPCTTVPRTLLDLAAVIPVWELRKAIAEAEVLRLLNHGALRRLIKRSRGRRGVARLRMLLDDIHPQTRRTRSELERAFLRLCARTGLPEPEVNVKLDVGGLWLTPDFLWRDVGLIVECDGRRYHDTGSAFQLDRRREQRLMLAGWQVVRCTWEQVEREPQALAETIRSLLGRPDSPPTGRKPRHVRRNRPVGG